MRCISISVSFAVATHRSSSSRALLMRLPRRVRQGAEKSLGSRSPRVLNDRLIRRDIAQALLRKPLCVQQLAVEIPQGRVGRSFGQMLEREVEASDPRTAPLGGIEQFLQRIGVETALAVFRPLRERAPLLHRLVEEFRHLAQRTLHAVGQCTGRRKIRGRLFRQTFGPRLEEALTLFVPRLHQLRSLIEPVIGCCLVGLCHTSTHQRTTTCRTALPSCSRSKPRLISSSGSVPVIKRSTGNLPPRKRSTKRGMSRSGTQVPM